MDFGICIEGIYKSYRQLGEPELGSILVCEADDHIANLSAPAVQFTRADTMMKGGTHCPFRYSFNKQSTQPIC